MYRVYRSLFDCGLNRVYENVGVSEVMIVWKFLRRVCVGYVE